MIDLTQIFAALCGQNLDHSWAPGGIWLPFCQRCTGLYAGAATAALLHIWLKPRPTAGFLWAHGSFLLFMVPFGFHWLPQGPAVRALTGVLFGFATTAFLWLPLNHFEIEEPSSKEVNSNRRTRRSWLYAFMLATTLLTVLLLGAYGGEVSAAALTVLGCLGAATLSILVLANIGMGFWCGLKVLARSPQAQTP